MIRLIAATDSQRGIAVETGIPWKLPGDSAYFHQQTSQGLIVMGWGTYTEFASPLHDRVNYVLTSRTETLREGFQPASSVAELHAGHPDDDVWVIGGAFVYTDTIGQADELLLTQVLGNFHCTKFFPPYEDHFTRVDAGAEQRDGAVAYRFERWRRAE